MNDTCIPACCGPAGARNRFEVQTECGQKSKKRLPSSKVRKFVSETLTSDNWLEGS